VRRPVWVSLRLLYGPQPATPALRHGQALDLVQEVGVVLTGGTGERRALVRAGQFRRSLPRAGVPIRAGASRPARTRHGAATSHLRSLPEGVITVETAVELSRS